MGILSCARASTWSRTIRSRHAFKSQQSGLPYSERYGRAVRCAKGERATRVTRAFYWGHLGERLPLPAPHLFAPRVSSVRARYGTARPPRLISRAGANPRARSHPAAGFNQIKPFVDAAGRAAAGPEWSAQRNVPCRFLDELRIFTPLAAGPFLLLSKLFARRVFCTGRPSAASKNKTRASSHISR